MLIVASIKNIAKSSLFRAVGDIKTQLKICECQKVRGIGTLVRVPQESFMASPRSANAKRPS